MNAQDKAEKDFRTWLKKNYGIQDYEAYKNSQTEEIAIQYASHLIESDKEKIQALTERLEKMQVTTTIHNDGHQSTNP